ncbi:MAG: hypothetical protein QOE82_2177 [Thermoanaerobaculia bacterium]|jgi:hypothetical protein|nr:hypothetical protein [Thermoanaerobaculia bacterium]
MKTKSKFGSRKLVLHRETIKRLTVEDLRSVRGGLPPACGETDCKSDSLCTKVTS